MRLLILSLMTAFLFSSCAVHVYHHNGDTRKTICDSSKKANACTDCKKGKDCTDCKKSPDCSSGQCPLKKPSSKSGAKPCCQS